MAAINCLLSAVCCLLSAAGCCVLAAVCWQLLILIAHALAALSFHVVNPYNLPEVVKTQGSLQITASEGGQSAPL